MQSGVTLMPNLKLPYVWLLEHDEDTVAGLEYDVFQSDPCVLIYNHRKKTKLGVAVYVEDRCSDGTVTKYWTGCEEDGTSDADCICSIYDVIAWKYVDDIISEFQEKSVKEESENA